MIGNIIAGRYAKALFELGAKKGEAELSANGEGLEAVAGVVRESPELLRVLKNPIFSPAEKKGVMDKILEAVKVNPTVTNLIYLLTDKDRIGFLPEINEVYASLLDEAKGVMRGKLVTAVDIADAKREDIKTKLESQTGHKLVLDYETDPDILGGMVVKIGDRVLDASLKAQLSMIKENIKRGE